MASTLGSLFCTWMLGGSVAAAPWWPQIGLNFSTLLFLLLQQLTQQICPRKSTAKKSHLSRIVTAAHCVDDQTKETMSIILGEFDLSSANDIFDTHR